MKKFTEDYYNLLNTRYAGINLTRINNFEEFENKQIIDSIEPYKSSKTFKEILDKKKVLIDVGFGGGFPILPLAKLLPEYKFFGIETRNKKVVTVGKIATELEIENTKLIHQRIENVIIDMDTVITFKAVGKVNDFLERINTDRFVEVFFYKGPGFYELENDQLKEAKKKWEIIEETKLIIPGTDERNFIGFRNKNPIINSKHANQLVKLSSFN